MVPINTIGREPSQRGWRGARVLEASTNAQAAPANVCWVTDTWSPSACTSTDR